MRSLLLMVLALLSADVAAAQATNQRFGKWKLKSDAPAPASNIMTYEPYGARGMKVIIDAVNARGESSRWWYVTELDGQRLYAGTQDPEVKSLLMANTQAAFERGAFGSPTFFVGSEIFFGKDRLREVEEEIVRQRAA